MPVEISINAEYLIRIQAILRQYLPEAEVWAYGSRVNGHAHAASDLDLVIRNPGNLTAPAERLAAIRSVIAESDIPILIDIHDWARLPESFRSEIEKLHAVIQPGIK